MTDKTRSEESLEWSTSNSATYISASFISGKLSQQLRYTIANYYTITTMLTVKLTITVTTLKQYYNVEGINYVFRKQKHDHQYLQ